MIEPAGPFGSAPRTHWLSNGRYRVLFSAAGSGFSDCNGLALTRWQGDATVDGDGWFLYLRDPDRTAYASAASQPAGGNDAGYRAAFSPGRARIDARPLGIDTVLEICVSPDQDLELRRLRLTNPGVTPRRLEVTSYLEAVLNHREADAAHPAFSRLFLQTEALHGGRCLVARRRPRSATERPASMAHWLAGDRHGELSFETDRTRFLGRGRGADAPAALVCGGALGGSAGSVLDTALCLRTVVDLAPGETRELVFCLAAGEDPTAFTAMLERYDVDTAPRVSETFERASAFALSRLDAHGFQAEDEVTLAGIAGALHYRPRSARYSASAPAPASRDAKHPDGNRAVVPDGRPLLVARIDDPASILPAWLGRAHDFWKMTGLSVQIVLAPDSGGTVATRDDGPWQVLESAAEPHERDWLCASADVFLDARLPESAVSPAAAVPPDRSEEIRDEPPGNERIGTGETLHFDNGYGGFSPDGREYVIRTGRDPAARPPLAWSNVIANEALGCIVSEAGAACTWSVNSRENRLTPWLNDPSSDPHAEAVWLRDERSGRFWSPTPGPTPDGFPGETRHGFGYTRFLRRGNGLEQEVVHFCAREDAVRFVRVRLRNTSGAPMRLSVFQYQQLVLGVDNRETAPYVVSEHHERSGALLAVNRRNGEFSARVAFAATVANSDAGRRFTADREAFLGRNGRMSRPGVIASGSDLDGRCGALLDPCLAFQATFDIEPGSGVDCAFLLGQEQGREAALAAVSRYATIESVDAELERVRGYWAETLGTVRIETPAPEIDLMVNGWLQYQNLSCRLWGRSATYQSGGAFGFRDQLQDTGSLVWLDPRITRDQILLHAGHQFPEGDVLHWWHPPLSKGIRTRFSDDLLWLPFITAHYLGVTADHAVLEETVGFRSARLLEPGEDEAFLYPELSGETATLYEHCCLAIDRSLTRGAHGLPLMGSGDWNDGMNRVGREGRGESVWLGFFLYDILCAFVPLCRARGDERRVARYEAFSEELRAALNDGGWDGAWYRRAYYDDGTPLGSAGNRECRIDAIAQAWSVISGAAPPERVELALDSLEEHLIDETAGIIRLLTPAFDKTPHDPGYIKGYVPGVRENGGQYTHGVLWAVQALAQAGRRERAARCLSMLSPVSHARDRDGADTYKVEPYVIAADVYGAAPHIGRGGWTWYTGSAGWMFRVALESVLGLRVEGGNTLRLEPRIPADWEGYRIRYRFPGSETVFRFEITNRVGGAAMIRRAGIDGVSLPVEQGALRVPVTNDGREHRVTVELA